MVVMFLGASIPLMEKRSLERRPQYQDVIDRVPMLSLVLTCINSSEIPFIRGICSSLSTAV